jgi:Mg-chelatase subunit ChlD
MKSLCGLRASVVLALGLLIAMGGGATAQDAGQQHNVMLIVDASGSMKKQVDGESRMAAAKRVLAQTLATIPGDVRLGLLAYGHRKAKDCTDMELVSPIGAEDAGTIAGRIQKLTPKGETPIAASLEMAAKSFLAFKGQINSIVLVTDGIEECKGDPCAAAAAIKAAGLDLKVDIVGFTLTDAQRKLIECVTTETGGTYYDAKNGKALTVALASVAKAAVAKPKEPDDNLLDPKNGGVLVAGANDDWQMLNDGKEERAVPYAGVGVYAFKDGKPATLTGFDVLIPEQSEYNLKDFELFAGDDGPTGAFHSIGSFTTQNIKLMKDPYQHFTFPPVTARYLKVSLNTDHGGGYIAAYEFRAHGKVDATAAPSPVPVAATGIDLLSAENGGALLAAPNDEWSKLNDGSDERAVTYSGEGVWGFKDGQAATFDRFEMLIPSTNEYNVKEFELLAGDESPTGSFHSIGSFTTQNIKFMKAPYQAFTFAPVTAKYLKVVLKTDSGGGYIAAYDFRLFGQIASGISSQAETKIGETPVAETDLLAPTNGGTLLAAPNDEWSKLNDGAPDRAVTYSGEGVWGFKDGKPATFDRFEMLIPEKSEYNVKDFELLAGDEGPTGSFHSIGTFATQNIKLMQSPYQAFTFAPVTAKYLKVAIKTDWGGGYAAAYDFRLFGRMADEAGGAMPGQTPGQQLGQVSSDATDTQQATTEPAAPVADGPDLLSQASGGELVAAPNDEWQKLNDGSEERAVTYSGEGIWQFANGAPTSFDTFEMLIPEKSEYNVKEFELQVGDDGPTGNFRSIGTFSAQNMKMMQSPYQRFTFPPVTAKFLKVILKTDQGGGYIAAYEFRLKKTGTQ